MWLRSAQLAGYQSGSSPKVGAIGVYRYGNHVVYVEGINPDNSIFISEMNYHSGGGGEGIVSHRNAKASDFTFIY